MSYVVGGVTIPSPAQVSKRNPAKVDEFQIEGLPVLIVPGLGAEELTVEGFLVGTKATLESTYLLPIEALLGTEVVVAFPDTRYDGTWVLAAFDYVEVNAKKFSYSLKLLKGSSHVVL